MNIPDFYFTLLYSSVLPLLFMLFLAGIHQAVSRREETETETLAPPKTVLPIDEIAAACGFIIIPIICVISAKFVTGAFADRYALSAVIGLSILVSFAAAKLYNNNSLIAAVLVFCFLGWFGVLIFKDFWKPSEVWGAYPEAKIELIERKGNGDLPIVAADPYTFSELERYAPPEIWSRCAKRAEPSCTEVPGWRHWRRSCPESPSKSGRRARA